MATVTHFAIESAGAVFERPERAGTDLEQIAGRLLADLELVVAKQFHQSLDRPIVRSIGGAAHRSTAREREHARQACDNRQSRGASRRNACERGA